MYTSSRGQSPRKILMRLATREKSMTISDRRRMRPISSDCAAEMASRRKSSRSRLSTAVWLTWSACDLIGFISVYVTPMLKYPANPPSVGLPETISMRTSLYFALILIVAMIAAGMLRKLLNPR